MGFFIYSIMKHLKPYNESKKESVEFSFES